VITEEQDIVYRGEPDPNAPPAPPQPAPGDAVWKRTTTPDAVMLFRYSALGFNGHRIHYDHPYVTKTEGYPDLVVPAGLHTMLVFELMRDSAPARRCKFSGWRNVRPLFVDRPLTACGEPAPDGKSAKLWVVDDRNALCLSMNVEFE
jgi:3-methylfumaryl-CoA hydratase